MRVPAPATKEQRGDDSLSALARSDTPSAFSYRMEGNSMVNAHIPDGALVIADRSVPPQSGMLVIVEVNGEYTVRRLVRTRKLWVLHADNPSFPPIPVVPEMQWCVHGVVTAVVIKQGPSLCI